jgi:hypothetical protein
MVTEQRSKLPLFSGDGRRRSDFVSIAAFDVDDCFESHVRKQTFSKTYLSILYFIHKYRENSTTPQN